jgi:hypothetical protein
MNTNEDKELSAVTLESPLDALLGCPFCGGRPGKRDLRTGNLPSELLTGHARYMIGCPKCAVAQSGNTWEEAIAAWNTRAGRSVNSADAAEKLYLAGKFALTTPGLIRGRDELAAAITEYEKAKETK